MQYEETKVTKTKLGITSDFATSICSSLNGANIDAIGFNIDYIARRAPNLVPKLYALYEQARKIQDKEPLDKNDKQFTEATDKLIAKAYKSYEREQKKKP